MWHVTQYTVVRLWHLSILSQFC